MRARALIFDLFDTLTVGFDDRRWRSTIAAMAATVRLPYAPFSSAWDTQWNALISGSVSVTDAVTAACRTLDAAPRRTETEAAAATWRDYTHSTLQPRPDAAPLLAALRERGVPLGLISDCTPDVPPLWRDSPLSALIDAPVFSCVAGVSKPAPDVYFEACRCLGVTPADCLYVGDGAGRELTGAAMVGMTPVLLRFVDPLPPELAVFRPDAVAWSGLVIRSLEELPALLRLVGGPTCA